MGIAEEKQQLRKKIWNLLEEKKVARFPLPLRDRIPNFEGAEIAAEKVGELPEWKKAKVIESNPDYAQHKVRELALRNGKILIMASPKLKAGFIKIDPKKIKGKEFSAATIRGAFKFGEKLAKIPKVDLKITGSVAVDKDGGRLGKGGGFGDREVGNLKKKYSNLKVITTIHDFQITDRVPVEEWDQKVDIIVTPTRTIRT